MLTINWMCWQIKFQPGNGKVLIKEPKAVRFHPQNATPCCSVERACLLHLPQQLSIAAKKLDTILATSK